MPTRPGFSSSLGIGVHPLVLARKRGLCFSLPGSRNHPQLLPMKVSEQWHVFGPLLSAQTSPIHSRVRWNRPVLVWRRPMSVNRSKIVPETEISQVRQMNVWRVQRPSSVNVMFLQPGCSWHQTKLGSVKCKVLGPCTSSTGLEQRPPETLKVPPAGIASPSGQPRHSSGNVGFLQRSVLALTMSKNWKRLV